MHLPQLVQTLHAHVDAFMPKAHCAGLLELMLAFWSIWFHGCWALNNWINILNSLGSRSYLCDRFHELFNICQMLSRILLIKHGYNLNFLRRLHDILADRWETILRKFENIHLNYSLDGIMVIKFSLRNQLKNIWREIYLVPTIYI
jgi:hypothetical protein